MVRDAGLRVSSLCRGGFFPAATAAERQARQFDPFWIEGGEQPCAVARKPYGRIAIANSDAGAYAYTDAAIDHGYRAVQELTAKNT